MSFQKTMLNKFHLTGLTCTSCKKLCEMFISEMPGVTSVNVDLNKKTVEINSDRKIELNEVREALKETHYEATN